MTERRPRKKLLPATGAVLVHDFCRAAGIDQQRLLELAEADVVFLLFRTGGEPFGLLDDRLPSAAELREAGVVVPEDYLSRLRYDLPEDATSRPEDASWTMGWD